MSGSWRQFLVKEPFGNYWISTANRSTIYGSCTTMYIDFTGLDKRRPPHE